MDRWQAFNQYQELQRQQKAAREQGHAEQRRLAELEVAQQQALREQQRREAEQRRVLEYELAKEQTMEQQRHQTETRQAEALQRAEVLRLADQQRNAALAEAHKQMQEIRARRPDIPYDTFVEQFFHEAWKKAHPDIELIPQYHIGPFRVDFGHESSKTVIELNGSIHSKRRVRNRDAPRHRYLESVGWHVLPFTNDETNYSMSACVEEVYAVIVERQGTVEFGKAGFGAVG